MKVQAMEAIYGATNTNTSLVEKRGFRTVESKYVDGTEVRLQRLSHDIHERVVVGYDRFGRAVYGTQVPQSTFEVRDSKESEPNNTAP
ncbi:hypothetical protein pEaSNUABM40_00294 [Erwinia phage pEa_SNUABM_40]|uniref:Uncharacterized protein n=1 Tax=Erwinia phage pEa_SNUABM_3 TaxID=2869552 RepID=A0AAE7XHQ2_9CAUD|nr:hypothetical protein MPK68_gp292 [Erwinia phage pEa_SNUABM_3]QZE56826.1 hypothetical protein pEaSNUABM20_00290 [Erwinia phage pEa_SNUABM_20]QZE58510.1 hypothetical protein pEaSNUABM40_00294 [Erwinia phage pEa_SNUABM_40]UAW53071.1 hypothetical protein pEaSNUABM23_00289 [Erwinia phage pEa_SNUABM_23]UIW10966.1 hypothetical protein pEaSNUABM23_00289 [Erwinia phage pEa_SNUABM_31]QZE56489.1 hypothetical protein pEaSNUABM3_00292 [Erwinia phage pEa_SNUABM_3]